MIEKGDRIKLLPPDALRDKSLGISASDSPDLDRLGLSDTHFRMTLGELTRTVIAAGGVLYYGGDLRSKGITPVLIEELERYGRRHDRPLKVCLAWTIHNSMSVEEIAETKKKFGLLGEIYLLSLDGKRLEENSYEPSQQTFTSEERVASLSGLRTFMADNTDARIVLGGKREGFQGNMPGIFEEVLLSLKYRQALYLAGGFGGATLDVIRALRPAYARWLPSLRNQRFPDERTMKGIGKINEMVAAMEWDGYDNGLSDEENSLLAASYRPSEIAALVGKGLGNYKRWVRTIGSRAHD